MSSPAHVASLAALDSFRSSLIVYRDKAGRLLDDVRQEAVSTRVWLQSDRQVHWKSEIRKRSAKLAQAEQELLTARLGGHSGAIQDRRMAVQKAKAVVEEAQERISRVQGWLRNYDREVESRRKAVQRLRQFLSDDLKKAVAYLETALTTLTEYAEMRPASPRPPGVVPPPVVASGDAAGPKSVEGDERVGGAA